jgi:hypothetical protein
MQQIPSIFDAALQNQQAKLAGNAAKHQEKV